MRNGTGVSVLWEDVWVVVWAGVGRQIPQRTYVGGKFRMCGALPHSELEIAWCWGGGGGYVLRVAA
jgi:hypothetical protein